jgi:CDP-paratose 2-epimerase
MGLALITGSSGLVGSETSAFLINKGFEVIGIDNNERRRLFGSDGDTSRIRNRLLNFSKSYQHLSIDITKKSQIEKIFKKYKNKFSFILHAAAQPSHDWAKSNIIKDFNLNAVGSLYMLEFTRLYSPGAKFIFMSTNKLYGDNPNKLSFIEKKGRWEISKSNKFYKGIDETLSIDNCTHSFFGVSKAYADLLAQEYNNNFGMNVACFRAGCITGPNHAGAELHGFLSYLVKSCIKKKTYKLIGYKGKQVRDNIHSSDLTNAFWFYFKKPVKDSLFNIGGSRYSNCSILEAIQYVEKKINITVNTINIKTPRVGDHQWYISDISKFKKNYPDFRLKYNIFKILDEIIDAEINL